jgi:hypothetical protein
MPMASLCVLEISRLTIPSSSNPQNRLWLPLLALSALEGQVLGKECGSTCPAGRGCSRALPSGDAPVDRCGACGTPAHAFRAEGLSCMSPRPHPHRPLRQLKRATFIL